MNVLLVEDETHKQEEMKQCVLDAFGILPEMVDGVNGAVNLVLTRDYDVIILDIALSTFGDSAEDKNKGHDQAQGGIEVLRALKLSRKAVDILIVTQYPDFYIGGAKVKLKDSIKIIGEKYKQRVVGAVLYQYRSKSTLQRITSLLRTLR